MDASLTTRRAILRESFFDVKHPTLSIKRLGRIPGVGLLDLPFASDIRKEPLGCLVRIRRRLVEVDLGMGALFDDGVYEVFGQLRVREPDAGPAGRQLPDTFTTFINVFFMTDSHPDAIPLPLRDGLFPPRHPFVRADKDHLVLLPRLFHLLARLLEPGFDMRDRGIALVWRVEDVHLIPRDAAQDEGALDRHSARVARRRMTVTDGNASYRAGDGRKAEAANTALDVEQEGDCAIWLIE